MKQNENKAVRMGSGVRKIHTEMLTAGAENTIHGGAPRPFLFELEPVFAASSLDSCDRMLFDHGLPASNKDRRLHFKEYENPYIENELRAFVRHLIIDNHMAPRTLKTVFTCFLNTFEEFAGQYLPAYESISDYDFETLYGSYEAYLLSKGNALEWVGPHVVDGNMEYRDYRQKHQGLYLLGQFYRFVTDTAYPDTRPEFMKDVWDIRKLGVPYSIQADRPRYTLNFTKIHQPWFRDVAKKYELYRVQRRSVAAVVDDLKAFNRFSEYLEKDRPDITSFAAVDRKVMEGYFAFLRTFGYVNTSYNRRISVMKTFFEIGVLLGFEGFPVKRIITNEDYVKIVHQLPKFFSSNELKQMNEHLKDLPVQHGRIMFILENCGMRLSDLLGTTIMIDGSLCVQETEKGFVFTYCMPKVNRTNSIPVNELVGKVVLAAIEESRKLYGEDCTYIFAKSATEPIARGSFTRAMNKMAKEYDIRRDDGTPLRIMGHTFRGTIATQYANSGVHLDLIRLMLGQTKIGVLKHYITIHGDAMNAYMQPIHEENERLIQSIGKPSANLQDKTTGTPMIPLANGLCARKSNESCRHANACYRCRMFHPQKECLNLYRMQLLEAENNIAMADAAGYDKILRENKDLADRLKAIIASLEG